MRAEKLPNQASGDQLETLIAGLTDGVILLASGGVLRYANAAALQMHGVGHLDMLGKTLDEYKARFELSTPEGRPLPAGQRPLERLLKGESFSALTVCMSPAEATKSEAEGVWLECRGFQVAGGEQRLAALVLKDIGEQVEAERRFERTFEANPAPAIINRLSDVRYVKVNQGFLTMTGFQREDLIGRTIYDYDVLADVEDGDLRGDFEAGRTIPQTESRLPTKEGGTKFVIVAGQPLKLSDEPCILFSFIDLDERKKAENALRESEERFSKAFRLAPTPMSISSLEDYRILNANDAFEQVTGYGKAEVIGRTTAGLEMWVEQKQRDQVEAALSEGRGYRNLEVQLRAGSGEILDTLASAEVVTINEVPCILNVFQDITERRRSEADLVRSIEEVMKDASWFSRLVVEKLANLRARDRPEDEGAAVADLTKRERQVLDYMSSGWKNDQIARQLGVATNTVRNYVASIYAKIGVHSRADAILWAKARGIAGPEPEQ